MPTNLLHHGSQNRIQKTSRNMAPERDLDCNVRRANVKRTVNQPSGCAQSPLAFRSSYSGAISCAQLQWCLLDGHSVEKTVDLENYQNEGAVRDILQEHLSRLHHCGLR